jgi:two-component system sensor histidine kinase KdpD
VLRIVGRPAVPPEVDTRRLLLALATEAGIVLHRAELAEEASRAAALEHSDELKTALLSSVSHDLRTPLTAIKAAAGSLRDTKVRWTPEDTQGFLETIESQTDRLTAVVADLLEISRLEDGKVSLALEPVQVELLLTEVAHATSAATNDRHVTVEARPDLWVSADYALVMQALTNLVDNAARYSVPRGAIRLTADRAAPATVAISVIDDGPGIPAEDLAHVFEKFYRGVQARRSKGTGLGLAITDAMVRLCGGTISVASSLRGTAFTIELPATEAPR